MAPYFQLRKVVGLGRVELPTSPLSGVRSNQLSYRPAVTDINRQIVWTLSRPTDFAFKEVIQPQVPLGLPCYDFTPVMNHTVVSVLPKVRLPTSGTAHSHGVTGGVYTYSPRRSDPRLLAIPASCSRVADCNPDYDRFCEIRSTSQLRCPLYRPL
jgi:hypothetical protein